MLASKHGLCDQSGVYYVYTVYIYIGVCACVCDSTLCRISRYSLEINNTNVYWDGSAI